MCNLCNVCLKEDNYHFISICPILKILRENIFEKDEFSLVQYREYFRNKIKDDQYSYFGQLVYFQEYGTLDQSNKTNIYRKVQFGTRIPTIFLVIF